MVLQRKEKEVIKMTIEELSSKIKKLETIHLRAGSLWVDDKITTSFYRQIMSVIEGIEVRTIENFCEDYYGYDTKKHSLPLATFSKITDEIRIPFEAIAILSPMLICHICDNKKIEEIWGKVIIG
jgi:hypothetical protein